MPKTLATANGFDEAAFDLAQKRLDALKALQLQTELINGMRERALRSEARELKRLDELRTVAEKLGAYELIAPLQAFSVGVVS